MGQRGLIFTIVRGTSGKPQTSQYLLHNGLSTGDSFQLLVISNDPVLTAVAENRQIF